MPRRTIGRAVECRGTGLHTGAECRLRLEPAPAGYGIAFVRCDLPSSPVVPARLRWVTATDRRTALQRGGARVESVEHVMAAVVALEIDDLHIAVEGAEVPNFDGSFAPFASLLHEAGMAAGSGEPEWLGLREPLTVVAGGGEYRVEPGEALAIEVTLDYVAPVIGRQAIALTLTPEVFLREVAPARTYGFLDELEALRARGLVTGATVDSGLVLAPDRVVHGNLRWPDEFARHKLGDLLGDLALLGRRLAARVRAWRPSHEGNLACARAIAQASGVKEERA